MARRLRLLAGTCAAALAVAALAVPLALPAQAVVPVELEYFVADGDGDGKFGLWQRTPPTGAASVAREHSSFHLSDLSVSRDGSRIVYIETTYNGEDADRSKIVVRDVGSATDLVVQNEDASGNARNAGPALSPNGQTVVFDRANVSLTETTFELRRAPVAANSTSTTVKAGHDRAVFLDSATLLARSRTTGEWSTLTLDGAVTSLKGTTIPPNARQLTTSPDGAKLAWSHNTTPPFSEIATSDIEVADIALANGEATVSGTTELETGLDNTEPTFSRNCLTVYWVKWNGDFNSKGDIWSRPLTSGTSAATPATINADELDVAIGGTGTCSAGGGGTTGGTTGTTTGSTTGETTGGTTGTTTGSTTGETTGGTTGTTTTGETTGGTTGGANPAPGAVVVSPTALNGTSATLRWTPPSDPDLSGVQITCLHGATVQRNVFVPVPATSYVNSGLTLGATYSCSYVSRDQAAQAGPAASRSFTALRPAPQTTDPTSTSSTRAAFPVTFAAVAPANARFYVDYLPAGTSTWLHWVNGAPGRIRTFGAPATTNVLGTTSTPGRSYTFRVKVVDVFGNSSAFISSPRAVVPYDQTKATLSGGSNVASSSAYLGGYRRLWATSSYAKVTLVGNRLQVIGIRCSSCGRFAIYDNGTLVATIDTYASSTRARQVLFTRSYSAKGTHTYVIRPKATSGRPNVWLDGFAMRL